MKYDGKHIFFLVLYALATPVLIKLGAMVKLPVNEIPFTLQTFALILVALFFPRKAALWGCFIYLVLGMFLPMFSGTQYGVEVYRGESGGYLLSFPLAMIFLIGTKEKYDSFFSAFSWMLVIHAFILFAGSAWYFSLIQNIDVVIQRGFLNMLPGAVIKSLAGAMVWYFQRQYHLRLPDTEALNADDSKA